MAVVRKKVWSEYFEHIKSGKKNFDVRVDDFPIHEGDTLILEEFDLIRNMYTGRTLKKKVGFVEPIKPDGKPFFAKEDVMNNGLKVISLE